MTNVQTERWQNIRTVEDAMALCVRAKVECTTIRIQSWHEGDWAAVFEAATRQEQMLEDLQAFLSMNWKRIYHNGAENSFDWAEVARRAVQDGGA